MRPVFWQYKLKRGPSGGSKRDNFDLPRVKVLHKGASMKKLALLGIMILLGCVEQKALDFEDHFEGQDVRSEFLKQYSGVYRLPNPDSGTVQGLDQGDSRLVINADGSYVLVGEKKRVSKDGDQRTAICTVEERGQVTHVQKFAKTKEHVQVGRVRVGNLDPVGGLLILEPQDSKFNHAETVITDQRGEINVDKENPFTEKEFKWLCARSKERVFYVENFLRDGLLLARKTENRVQKYFLEDRFIVREDTEWIWLDGEIARTAVIETSSNSRRGITGLSILKENVRGASEKTEKMTFAWDSVRGDTNKVSFTLGGKGPKTYMAFWMLTGKLVGVSYSRTSSSIVAHLADVVSGDLPVNLDGAELTEPEIKKIEEVAAAVKPLSDRVNNLDKLKNIVTVSVSTKEQDMIRVDTKQRQVQTNNQTL